MKLCLQCSSQIYKHENVYCDRRCYGLAKLGRTTPKLPLLLVKNCYCGRSKSSESEHCSQECGRNLQQELCIAEWLAGHRSGGTWSGVATYVKFWLHVQFGSCCWECGWDKVHPQTGKVPVQIDHVNGDPYDHSVNNLRLLCPNCHSLTSSYGALNKGFGRAERKLYR